MADIKKILTRVKDYVTQEDNFEKTRAENAEETLQNNIDIEEQARIDAINALDLTQVGSAGNYIKFVSQEDGQVAAQKQAFDTDMTNATDDNAPTTKNVKDYVDNAINSLDKAEVGEDGKYIKKIKEDNGVITATLKEFDTLIDNSADNTNTPTTKAVKDYVDAEKTRATAAENILTTNLNTEIHNRQVDVDAEELRASNAEAALTTRIDNLDLTTVGEAGSYIKTVGQQEGQLSANKQAFDTNLQNADDTNAPTSLAVKDYVDDADTTLQHNIDAENSRALLAESTLAGNLTAEANARAAADTTLSNRVTTLENSTAVADEQARAIAAETALGARINALDLPTTGSAGSYIRAIAQADGQLSATVQQFDIDLTNVTNNNAPTTKLVDDTYSKILETVTDLSLSLDTTTYVLTVNLENRAGTVVAQDTVDLPIESLVTTARYDAANKEIILRLQSGVEIPVPVAALISGLQAEITAQNKLSSDLVDDTNKTHKFATAAQLTQISTNQNAIAAIKDGNSVDSFRDVEDALALKANQATTYTKTESDNLLNGKVDKVTGYALSKNDYSDAEKLKVTENTAARHSHTNQNLLDSYDQSNIDLADAVAKKHNHSNNDILDATTASFTTAYKNQLDTTAVSVDYDGTKFYKTLPTGQGSTIVTVDTLSADLATANTLSISGARGSITAAQYNKLNKETIVIWEAPDHSGNVALHYSSLVNINEPCYQGFYGLPFTDGMITVLVTFADDLTWEVIYDGAIAETTANRVSAFQANPDNTHYPTEKLVKDSLDLKANLTGNNTFTGANVFIGDAINGTTFQNSVYMDDLSVNGAIAASYIYTIDDTKTNTFKGNTTFTSSAGSLQSRHVDFDLVANFKNDAKFIDSNNVSTSANDLSDLVWNTYKSYAVGDIIFYNRALYICEVAVSASNAGNTNPAADTTHWTRIFQSTNV